MEVCDEDELKDKKKRQDRSDKLKENKGLDQTVVKCSLKGLLEKNENVKKLIDAIEKRVHECSHRVQLASVALNLLIRDKVHGIHDNELVNVSFPEVWDQTFVRQLLLGTNGAIKPIEDVKQLYEKYPRLLSNASRSQGDCQMYTFTAKKLGVNIKNHLVLNFPNVLKRYIKEACGLDNKKDEHVPALYRSNGWSMVKLKKEIKLTPETELKVDSTVNSIRTILGLEKGQAITETWIKRNPCNILRFFIFANRQFETLDMKMINILPLCRTKAHFVTFDNMGMLALLKDINWLDSKVKDMTMDIWHSVINTNKVRGRNCTFTGTIDTDGLVVNVHFQRKKRVANENVVDKGSLVGKRVLACDPGRSNIFFIVEKRQDDTFKRYRLTRCQYYKESGINAANKTVAKWLHPIQSSLDVLSTKSPKSVNLQTFQEYVDAMLQVADALWKESLKKRWREQRFRLYGGKKRVFANFINGLNPDHNTVLAYGSAKFAPGGKGEVSVPVSQAYKECTFRMKTVLVDEFRTTMVHWKDDTILKKVGLLEVKEEKQVTKNVRGLLWCGLDPVSTIEKGKFVNRDLNAAINIYRCAVSLDRPEALDRTLQKVSLPKTKTKIIVS